MSPARSILLLIAAASLSIAGSSPAPAAAEPRGGRVGWARLITRSAQSSGHITHDAKLAAFIRAETSLNIDPTWYTATPGDLDQLCNYPFLYAQDLTGVTSPRELNNLKEYVLRGGFICIDPCVNAWSDARKATFIHRHAEQFARIFPGSVTRELMDDHEIYRTYFNVTVHDLFTPDVIRAGGRKPARIGMQGVFLEDRLIAVISTSGLECGWPQTPQRAPGCMKMILNTYVYAMTR